MASNDPSFDEKYTSSVLLSFKIFLKCTGFDKNPI